MTKVFHIRPGFTQANLRHAIADHGMRAHEVYCGISTRKRKGWRKVKVTIATEPVLESGIRLYGDI